MSPQFDHVAALRSAAHFFDFVAKDPQMAALNSALFAAFKNDQLLQFRPPADVICNR